MMSAFILAQVLWSPREVPRIAVGPETKDEAPLQNAPIREVTVYSDRARIRRKVRVDAKAGISSFRLPDLPGGVFLDTVRVLADGGRVVRVEASPVEREVVSIEQVKGLIDELETVTDRMRELEHALAIERRELERIQSVRPLAPVEEKDRDGRRPLPVSTDSWFRSIDFLASRDLAARARIQKAEAEMRELATKRDELAKSIEAKNLGAFTDRRVEVFVAIESPAAKKVELVLEYFMPGARWKPAYDLRYEQNGKLKVEIGAMVQQATGEDWNDVALSLSTAIPGQGIELPELLTWTLGESRDFVPVARAARTPPAPPPFAPPQPQPTRAEERRRIELEVLRQRFAQAMGRPLATERHLDVAGKAPAPSFVPEGSRRIGDKEADERPAPRSMRLSAASVDEDSVTLTTESTGYASRSVSYVRTPLALFEAPQQQITFADPYLPAITAGGLDYVYAVPARATIPSIAEDRRVPLEAVTFAAETFYEATPALDTTAYVRAKVKNGTGRPLLRGPANIYVGGELVGQGEIQTTGPGGEIAFPLGADENVRLVRTVVPTTKREGIFSKDDVTTYAVQLQIGNYKREPITIEVIDQIPKSAHEDVEIKLVSTNPQPSKAPDADGVMRWRISVPANQTRTISFAYTIDRPADWQLYQQ